MSATSVRHSKGDRRNLPHGGGSPAGAIVGLHDAPWGDEQQARFVNACIEIETGLAPLALLKVLQRVEQAFGRERSKQRPWGPRTLDLDLIAYDDVAMDLPN